MSELDYVPTVLGFALAFLTLALNVWVSWRERRRSRSWAHLRAMEERAVRLAYNTPPGVLFDRSAPVRRLTAVYILNGQGDPPPG